MAKPAKNFTASFDSLTASLGLKEDEEEYNKCRAEFFMEAMKFVNDKVVSGDPTAKRLEADYATLVETRGSQNQAMKVEQASKDDQLQATEDLELKFHKLINTAGTLPGEPGYKRKLRKFLTAEYTTNAQAYCSNARNIEDQNKTFKFEALALACGLEYDSPGYNKVHSDFFQKNGTLLDSALESAIRHREFPSTTNMAQGSSNSLSADGAPQKPDNESAMMVSLRNKLAAARLDGAVSEGVSQKPTLEEGFQELALSLGLANGSKKYKDHHRYFFEYESSRDHVLMSGDAIAIEKLERFEESCATRGLLQGSKEFRIFKSHFDIENESDTRMSSTSSFSLCGFSSADDDSQYALQFKGRLHAGNGNNFHHGQTDDRVAGDNQGLNKKQPKRGNGNSQNDGAQNGGAQKNSSQQDRGSNDRACAHKDHGQNNRAQNDGPQKTRAQRAKDDFDSYFGDPGKLENWQRLCRDLDIDPVPSSITQCKKEAKKIYVNIYQFLHQIKTGAPATRFRNQAALAAYCNAGKKRKFPRNIAKSTGALAGLLHFVN
ncbi:hypothetical protein V492_07407 [Pseudogymnoascus sp. VKM F-4246]|nr:hypothetical protein V492_07407 [Pseudogymnoascus sp. VKM F-4246]